MRRAILFAISIVGLTALSGCPKAPRTGECKTSKDCLAQEGFGNVCVEGRCQECGTDTDCREGFICRENKCVPRPECQVDGDCPTGQRCENERCVAPRAAAVEPRRDVTPSLPPGCADPQAFTVRFGFDQATLSPEAQESLQRLSDCLRQARATSVMAEGHADERGTSQYNIALAARRAEAARRYLLDLGAGGAQVETVSYGEERPLCSDASESCWARNRRVEFQIGR
jgi:peptidoglycan-associated lipoprotein